MEFHYEQLEPKIMLYKDEDEEQDLISDLKKQLQLTEKKASRIDKLEENQKLLEQLIVDKLKDSHHSKK